MSRHRLARLGGLAAVGALLVSAAPATAAAHRVSGTVVHHNARAHSFVIASTSGHLTKVYSRHAPAVGRAVRVTTRQVGGRLKAATVHVGARHRRVKLRGTITYAGRGAFTISAAGASILVKAHRARRLAKRDDSSSSTDSSDDSADSTDSTGDSQDSSGTGVGSSDMPPVGNEVIVISKINQSGDLEEEAISDLGADATKIEVEGIIESIDTTTRLVTVSADDDGESGATITVQLSADFDLSQLAVGGRIDLELMRLPDGTYEAFADDAENPGNQGGDNGGDDGGA